MKKASVKFKKILLNDPEDARIDLILDGRHIGIEKKFVNLNTIILNNDGKGPEGTIEVCVNFLAQRGLYHLVKQNG